MDNSTSNSVVSLSHSSIKTPEFIVNDSATRQKLGSYGSSNPSASEVHLGKSIEEVPNESRDDNSVSFVEDITYLNELCKSVKVAGSIEESTVEDVIKKICRHLISRHYCIRAVCLRIIRLICINENVLCILLRLQIDLFLSRALELSENNDEERIEALKLCSVMLQVYSKSDIKIRLLGKSERSDCEGKNETDNISLFPKSVLLSIFLIAKPAFCEIGEDFSHRKFDKLALPCFAVFLENAINEPFLVLEAAGTGWIVDTLLIPNNKWVSVLVCRILCLWLDHPRLRTEGKLSTVLEQIFAPIVEIGFFQGVTIGEIKVSEERIQDLLDSCYEVLLNLLRTWSGLYSCASSDRHGQNVVASPFRLLEYLGCGTVVSKSLKKMRDIAVNLCCELMNCSYAGNTFQSWSEAVQFYSRKDFPDSYKCSLREDFILAEHDYSLGQSEIYCNRLDLLKSFRSMTLFFLIDSGVLPSLIRLILFDPEDPVSLKATLLLNDFIFMGSLCLPLEWRLRVLSVPTLVQRICEIFTVNTAVAAIDGTFTGAAETTSDSFTFMYSGSVPLLLYRLDVLNNIVLSAHAQRTFTGNMQLFVQAARVKACHNSLSGSNSVKHEELNDFDVLTQSQIASAFEMEGKPRWAVINNILQLLECEERVKLVRHKHYERLYIFFSQMFLYFSPSSGQFIISTGNSHLPVAIFSRCLSLTIPLCTIDIRFEELVTGFLADFVDLISADKLTMGLFSLPNLFNSNAMYYFAFVGAISSEKYGCELLEKMKVLQTFVDIITTATSAEYIKLIVSCLDYSNDAGFTRLVLQTAVTSASETGRKWATRFLSVLAEKDSQTFSGWGMSLLMGQLADPSAKVVRHAVRLLIQWIPAYPECFPMLRKLRLEAFGDAGVILRTYLFGNEKYVIENPKVVRSTLDLWKKEFNVKYVDMVEDDVKAELVNVKRSLDGNFARTSNDRSKRSGVYLPVHLYGQLGLHETGRNWLLQSKEVDRMLSLLRDTPANMSYGEIKEVKAAIFALSQFVTSLDMSWTDSMAAETITIICRYAEACPVLSVRGSAFWALNLIGSCGYGARFLRSVGWESTRYDEVGESVEEWEMPNIDAAKLWISSLDVCTSDPHYIVKKEFNQLTSLSRPCRSSTAASSGSWRQVNDYVERGETLRSFRSYTNDSVETSGLGSTHGYDSDATSVLISEIDYGIPNIPQRHIGDESVPTTISDRIGSGKLHHSSITRARLGMPSFEVGTVSVMERFLAPPVMYRYMSHSELKSYRKFRSLYTSTPEVSVDDIPLRFMQPERPFVVLPCVVALTSKNIFTEEPYVSLVAENIHGKLGNPEELEKCLEERRRHRSDRCFFCSFFETIVDGRVPSVSKFYAEERNALLTLVETRLSKDSLQKANEKKILGKYEQNPGLFSCPCVYWDVFELLSDSRYRSETRRLLHLLFTDALNLIASHCIKM